MHRLHTGLPSGVGVLKLSSLPFTSYSWSPSTAHHSGFSGSTHHHSGCLQTQGAPAQEESQPCQHGHPVGGEGQHKLLSQEDTLTISPVLYGLCLEIRECVYSQDEQPAGLLSQSQQDEQTHYKVKQQQQHIREPPVKHKCTT